MCELLVGLPEVNVLAVVDDIGHPLVVHIEQRVGTPPPCPGCGTTAWVKERPRVELVDLSCFGRPARLVGHKHRWRCRNRACDVRSWTAGDRRIGPAREVMTDRAGRWVCAQVGRHGRPVAEVARQLGCDWHTVNDAVIALGTPLVDDPGRIGPVDALGLDETLFCRLGRWRQQRWCTSIVNVSVGRTQLLDVVPGRSAAGPSRWLEVPQREQLEAVVARHPELEAAWSMRQALYDPSEAQDGGRRRRPPGGAERQPGCAEAHAYGFVSVANFGARAILVSPPTATVVAA